MTASSKGTSSKGAPKKSQSPKDAARAKAAAMREEQMRKQRKTERMIRAGVAAAIVLALVIVGIVVQTQRSSVDEGTDRPEAISEAGGGFVYGNPDSAVTVDVWADFQCPYCKQFEEQTGATVNQLAADGKAKIVFHPLSFIGEESKTAANALGCAIDEGKGQEFIPAVFAAQGAENSGVFTDARLIEIGESVGASGDDFSSCVTDEKYASWVSDVSAKGNDEGVRATPTVKVNGEQLTDLSPAGLEKAVNDAAAS
jgi:protein-disulfide isomerase